LLVPKSELTLTDFFEESIESYSCCTLRFTTTVFPSIDSGERDVKSLRKLFLTEMKTIANLVDYSGDSGMHSRSML
jgi:hypothetical protein